MKVVLNICTLILTIIIVACSSKEKVINPVDNTQKILVATEGNEPKLVVYDLPALTVSTPDLITSAFGTIINNPIENIKEAGGNMYIFIPDDKKILIVQKSDLKLLSTVDFSTAGYEPVDIVFANATDGYIAHRNSVYISLLDLTNFTVARNITVGNPPHSIDVFGNQIYVTNLPDNTVSVIDSRDRREVTKIITEPNPSFVRIQPDGESAICISTGLGKYEQGNNKTPAYLQYIDLNSRQITDTYELGFAQISALEQIPQSFLLTPNDWGFISTQEHFFRLDVRTKGRINLVTRRSFYYIAHDVKREKLILLRQNNLGTDIMFADERTGEIGDIYNLPFPIKSVYPF